MVEKITPAEAIRLLDAGKAQAVDVREPDEFAVGHIPGAKLLPLGDVLTRAGGISRCFGIAGQGTNGGVHVFHRIGNATNTLRLV